MKKSVFTFFLMSVVAIPAGRAVGDNAKKDFASAKLDAERSIFDRTDRVEGTDFFDNFDSYTSGTQLVVQNSTDWRTWSNLPGSGEDPFVSDNFAYSGANSVVIAQSNDLVRTHGSVTSGVWKLSWQMYIPAGKAGYFNNLSGFDPNPNYWAMEVYFDAGGGGRLLTGDPEVDFTWSPDTWQQVEVIVDLDNDLAQFIFNGDLIHQWQWTLGTSGGTGPLQLDATDLYGATANDEMYVDDYDVAPFTGCGFSLALQGEEHRAGENIDFEIFMHHRRDKTVTVRVNAWIEDSKGNTVVSTVSKPTTFHEGDFVTMEMALPLANDLAAGTYRLFGSVGEMKQGEASARVRFEVLPGSSDKVALAENSIQHAIVPQATALGGNYPNPFNPSTTIRYTVGGDSYVTLRVYSLLGQLVRTLVDGYQVAGAREAVWDGRNESGASISSGIYIYRLTAGNFTAMKRMSLLK